MAATQFNYDPVKLAQQNNAFSAAEAEKQRKAETTLFYAGNLFNAQEAAKNRQWQEAMSNNAHQREIKDLQAAGLNPVLSATGGNGAAVTSGATASSLGAPSMQKAEVDTSANAALASLYNASLQYEAQLESIRTNAIVQRDIAREQAAASRYNADRAASASMYNAALNAATQTGINTKQLEQNQKLAEYDFEKQMQYRGFDRATQQQILHEQQYHDEYMKLYYPSNAFTAASSIGLRTNPNIAVRFLSPLSGIITGIASLLQKKGYHQKSYSQR